MKRMLNTMGRVWLAALVLTAMGVSAARADSTSYKNYGKVNLGMNDFTDDLHDADYDAGVAVSATFGRYLTKYLVVEGGANFFETNQDFRGNNAIAGSYSREDHVYVSALTATVKGEFPLGPVKLFGGAGIGGYYVSLNTEIDTSRIGDFDENDDDVVFGAHVVAGGTYDITPRIFAGFEGMYRWTGDVDIYQNTGTIPVSLDGNLNGYVVSVSAGFRF